MGRRIREVLATLALGSATLAGAATPALAVAPAPAGAAGARPDFDARAGDRARVPAGTADARDALGKRLGPQATVAADPVTGGLRSVARADGFLTGPSGEDAAAVALAYVRAHAEAFGLDAADLATLRETTRSTSPDGVTHVTFAQLDDGIGAYDSALTANVAADGRLINLGGAPVHDLDAPSTSPPLGPAAARAAAQRDLGLAPDGDAGTVGGDAARTTDFANGDRARLVTLADPDGDRLAWKLTVRGANPYMYEVLADAATGAILTRHSLTDFVTSNANVVEHHPGDGTAHTTDIGGYLSTPVNGLRGPNVHAYPDRLAPDGIAGDGEVAPSSGNNYAFTTTPATPAAGQRCPTVVVTAPCTWSGTTVASPSVTANVGQVTTQVFYYTNKFHDWLAQAPIGFTAASFNFEGADPLDAETDDYDGYNNANMSTPPDGESPVMQMFLFKGPSSPAVNGSDDATLVYHEYTHGLTNRLVGNDGQANGLIARQSQAMGEGWSDWYALDFLTAQGLMADTAAPGEQLIGAYVTDDAQTGIRTNAIDCAVGATSPHCPGTASAGAGGYTFGDLGKVDAYDTDHPVFEVHSDGEIWAETLWDLRRAIGAGAARRLITSALRLSPKQPSFLDMRNMILLADTNAGGTYRGQIWGTFAARGMGYSATTTSASSTHANEAFDLPPVAAAGAPDPAAVPLERDTVVRVPIRNPGGAPLTNVRATLAAAAPGVTVTQGDAGALGTLAGGGAATATFALRVAASAGCGAVAATTLTVTSDQGTQAIPVALPVGTGRSSAGARTYATPATIPEGQPATGLTSTLTVGSHGRIGALRVTLAATHAWIGDLHAWLTSPSGTTVDLMERPGPESSQWYSRANLAAASPLIFDDAAASPIQGIANTDTLISGPWKPNQALARFAGEDRFGTWTLRVTDAIADSGAGGSVSSWSLETADPACAITDAPTGLTGDSGTFHARIDPGSAAGTTGAFELGTTTAYGARSPATALTAGGGLQAMTLTSGGLTPGQTYHVRAIALRNGTIVATGADRTFVAGSDPGGGGPRGGDPGGGTGDGGGSAGDGSGGAGTLTPPPALKVPKATMSRLARTVRLDRKGRYTLSFKATPAKAKATIKLLVGKLSAGRKSFTVPANGRVKITIATTKKFRAALAKKTSKGLKAKATTRIGVTSFTATLTIKPYKKKAARR